MTNRWKISTTESALPNRLLWRIVGSLVVASALLPSTGFAIDLGESANKLKKAHEIDRQYVVLLRLKGKRAIQAIDVLLGEGFRCDLEPFSAIGLDEPPMSTCIKQPSGFGPLCDDLIVALRFERVGEISTRADLLRQLDTIKVQSALPFCPYKPEISAEYLALRGTAEQALRREVEARPLTGNAKSAYDKLLIEGFYCGFALEPGVNAGAARLACTKQPSGIKFCFESKLVMEVLWPPELKTVEQLFGILPSATVTSVQSSCEVPVLERGGPSL